MIKKAVTITLLGGFGNIELKLIFFYLVLYTSDKFMSKMNRPEQIKKEALAVAPASDYLTFIPKVIGIVQKTYKKDIASSDKKKMVIAITKELYPEAYSDDSIIDDVIELTFWLYRPRS